jgi:RNA polymerase sigma-32 factor
MACRLQIVAPMNSHHSPRERRRRNAPGPDHIRRTGSVPPLSREEEIDLTTRFARTRDPRLAQRLAAANLRLVIKMAARYAKCSTLPLADLVQEGAIGLMEAIERFDPGRGVRLASYATWWIRSWLLKYLLDHSRLVRAGRSRADRRGFFHGEAPAVELSLDSPRDESGEGEPLVDSLPDSNELPPDRLVEEAELWALLRRRAAAFEGQLGTREAAVFRERFLVSQAVPLRELAGRFEVTKERIRQIESDLIGDFREYALAA